MKKIFRPARCLLVYTCLAAALLTGSGCGLKETPSKLRLRSVQSGQLFAHQFPQAYYTSQGTGEYEIVLIDDGERSAASTPAKRGAPLQPSQATPLRQVVHIRVHWRPLRGTKPDHPSATNAIVDWHVTAAAGSGSEDRLHYQGAAFVELSRHGELAKIEISNGQVRLVEAVGSLTDPVGRSSISGTLVARRSETMVAAATAPLRLDAAAARIVRPAGALQRPRQGNGPTGGQ